jgi:ATP adenylyltransferase
VTNERLWAPWRIGYIKQAQANPAASTSRAPLAAGADPACFLCRAAVDPIDRENQVLHQGSHSVVTLNRYPYNNGHLLVAPRLHKATLAELTAEEALEIHGQLTRFAGLLERELGAQGFNVGLNLGRVAGAGVPGHLHWHIVPRWAGDANFMTTLASVQVIPQALEAVWELLRAGLEKGD